MVGLGQPGAVAQGDQIVGQLAHIGAVGHAHIERPVGGQGTVEQWHLDGVYGVTGWSSLMMSPTFGRYV